MKAAAFNVSNKIWRDKSLGEMQHNDCLQMPIQTLTESLPVQSKHQGIFYLYKVGFIAGQWNKVKYYKLKHAQ